MSELEPAAGRLLDRHLRFGSRVVPPRAHPLRAGPGGHRGSRGPRPTPTSAAPRSRDGVRSALYVNLLTEDNLPYYSARHPPAVRRRRRVGRVGPALDGRGGPPLDGDLRLPHGDPRHRPGRPRAGPHVPGLDGPGAGTRRPPRRARLPHAAGAGHPHRPPQHRQAARRPGRATSSWPGSRPTRTSTTSSTATSPPPAFELDPSGMVLATEREVTDFAMPGTGIPDFDRHAALIARAGIYDLAIHHSQIVVPVVVQAVAHRRADGTDPGGRGRPGPPARPHRPDGPRRRTAALRRQNAEAAG